jgi:uncharacterized membrane protein YoaK (UPF0700 family)
MKRTSATLQFAVLLTLANGFLDSYTYLARGGVFANVQTGNVIFFALDLSERKPAAALAVIGFIPASVPHSYVTVPISFLAATRALHVHAIWLSAVFLAVTLGLFIVDERRGIEP